MLIKRLNPVLTVISFFFKSHMRLLMLGMFLALITAITGAALLGISGWFITATSIAGLSTATAIMFDVFVPSSTIRFLTLARTASRYGERLLTHDATLAVLVSMREQVFRAFSRPSQARLLEYKPARILYRLTVDIDALDSFYLKLIIPFFSSLAVILLTFLILLGVHTSFSFLISGSLLSVGLFIPFRAALKARRITKKRAYTLESLRARIIDLVAGQTDLLMTGQLNAHCQSIIDVETKARHYDNQLNKVDIWSSAAFGFASTCFLGITLLCVISFSENKIISVPMATLILLLVFVALEPFQALQKGTLELSRTLLAAQRLGTKLTPLDFIPSAPVPLGNYALRIENAVIQPGITAQPIFPSFSFSILKNDIIALVGASGTGKTSLLKVFSGELPLLQGILEVEPNTLLTQRTELFQDTLRENLCLANPGADDQLLLTKLKDAGLRDFIEELPEGLSTSLGEGGLGLSSGQARRLSLARLFLRDTPLWLLDEPTEGLDQETAQDVINRLKKRAVNHTVIIATHLKREAEIADRILYLSGTSEPVSYDRGTEEFTKILISLR